MRSLRSRSFSWCSPRSRNSMPGLSSSSTRPAVERRAEGMAAVTSRDECRPRDARRARCSGHSRAPGSLVWMPIRTRTSAPSGQASPSCSMDRDRSRHSVFRSAEGKEEALALVSISRPRFCSSAPLTSSRCRREQTGVITSQVRLSRRVEPSMSVKTKVTVPTSRSLIRMPIVATGYAAPRGSLPICCRLARRRTSRAWELQRSLAAVQQAPCRTRSSCWSTRRL